MVVDITKAIAANDIKNGAGMVYTPNKPNQFAARPLVQKVFNRSGSWTCPEGVNAIVVECWGGGALGGSMSSNGAAGGGGGGAYVKSNLTVVPGQTYTIDIEDPASTLNPFVWFGSASTIYADGGTRGTDNTETPGVGGQASDCIGDIRISGQTGAAGNDDTLVAGYGGNAAGHNGGIGGAGRTQTQGGGVAGTAPGGGGGGALRTSSGARVGGTGARGRVLISYFFLGEEMTSPDIDTIEEKYTDRFDDTGYYA